MAWAVNSPWPAIRDFPTRTRTFILSPYDCSPRQTPYALCAVLRCLLRANRRWSHLTWDAGVSPTFSSITFSTGGLGRIPIFPMALVGFQGRGFADGV